MARSTDRTPKAPKEPGRIKQMWQVFKMTRRYDSRAVWLMALGFVLPVAAGVTFALIFSRENVFGLVMWILAGVLAGLLAALIILGRRAERAAYKQIEGQPGAVGAVLKSSLRRSWTGSEMPVAVNGRTQDAVYRAVGRGGVVLIGEGPKSRTTKMLEDERRKVLRILPNVPVTFLSVGADDDSVPLHRVAAKLARIKPSLTKPEVLAVSNRLTSLSNSPLPIPKGIDPLRVRPQRGR
ncbi:DUF4191 domain-containing protein [Herbiconiux moechotypicola]|uniref:DUF4191 domain-containing protein n=1 Tax=Herbiconiux moechotypicola TaxID=637393 RepID=A0ABP5Q233_9MICO|nr:DUF4191 domain-containing protein [Herbiconiux moechotypicola]MCS5728549.1 DUF4191 domain-containing protein [Herbiconiux moechotypicola]